MSLLYVLDERGQPAPADATTWSRWYERADDARRVARDVVADIEVSTVFLSVDHNHNPTAAGSQPVLWETTVFGGALDGLSERYTSRAQAVTGHARLLIQVLETAHCRP